MKKLIYTGHSMRPTLRDLDKLIFHPYDGKKIQPGDVVVIDDGMNRSVIHRVISVDARRIRTIGDNNAEIDSEILSQDQIAGKVIFAIRGKRKSRIHGGFLGRVQLAKIQSARAFYAVLFSALKPLYHLLLRINNPLFFPFHGRVIAFQRYGNTELHLYIGHHLVGKKYADKWYLRAPFNIIVDKSSLPEIADSKDEISE